MNKELFESIFKEANLKESRVNVKWVREYGNDPVIKNIESCRHYHEYAADDCWDAEDYTIAKEHYIKENFLWLVERYLILKLNNKTEEMLDAAEKLYKSFTDAKFFIEEFDLEDYEDYISICRIVNQPGFKPAKLLEIIKEDYAHPREGDYEWTYDKFVSEILPEIKEFLGK